MVSALLINDTQNVPHVGSQAITDAHIRMLQRCNVTISNRLFYRELRDFAKIDDPEAATAAVLESPFADDLVRVDAVIVNGEGTIHHGRGRELLAVLAAAQKVGKLTLLVNCVFQDVTEFHDTLRRLDDFTVRDPRSSRELDGLGIPHRLVLDAVLEAGFADEPQRDHSGKTLVTDLHGEVAETLGIAVDQFVVSTARQTIRWPLLGAEPASRWRSALAEVGTAKSVVSARHHGAYLAAMAGVPFVLLPSNSHKIEGFIEWTGLPIPLCRTAQEIEDGLEFAESSAEMFLGLQERILAERPLTSFGILTSGVALEKRVGSSQKQRASGVSTEFPFDRILAALTRKDTEAAALICTDWCKSAHDGSSRRTKLLWFARQSATHQGIARTMARAAEFLAHEPEVQLASGVAWRYAGDNEAAVDAYLRALDLQPDSHQARSALGIAQSALGNFDDAEANLKMSVALRPRDPRYHFHLAKVLEGGGRCFDAIGCLRNAIALDPFRAEYHYRLGRCLYLEGSCDQAIEAFDRCLEIDPDHARARYECGMARVHLGEFSAGWDMMEARWNVPRFRRHVPDAPWPRWDGRQDLEDALWIWSESTPGIGLEILYGSLIPEIVGSGVKVVFEAGDRLAKLFSRSLPGATVVIGPGALENVPALPGVTSWIASGSLPRLLRRTPGSFRHQRAYLIPDAELTASIRSGFRPNSLLVGISWKTGAERLGERRSIPLDHWQPILKTEGCTFVCLQYGDTADELEASRRASGVTILRDDRVDPLGNLDPYAAQIASMDLVITVDNSTAHLAGALGVPCWCLLPRPCYWQWPQNGESSRWYPSVRLVRQRIPGRWDDVLDRVAEGLKNAG